MFNRCSFCNHLYLFEISCFKCETNHRIKKAQEESLRKYYSHHFKRISDMNRLDTRRRDEEEARRRRNSRSTPTSNSVLDGTVYTGYGSYSDSSSYDSGSCSSSDSSSSSSSSSCDF